MPQTKAGAIKAKETMVARYGADHWQKIGALGGKAKVPKGFALDRERASIAGAKGGTISRRGKVIEVDPFEGRPVRK